MTIKMILSFKWMSTKFWIRLFLTLIACIIVLKIIGVEHITDTMALGAMGFVAGLIALYNQEKKNKQL